MYDTSIMEYHRHNSYAYFTLRWHHPVFSLQLHEPQKKVKSLHYRLHKLITINLKRHMIHSHPTHAKDSSFHGWSSSSFHDLAVPFMDDITVITIQHQMQDTMVCKVDPSGFYSTKSEYRLLMTFNWPIPQRRILQTIEACNAHK